MSIVQEWAANLGLRHQGVLVSAVRGCDSVAREDRSKYLVRVFRGVLLKSHCGDAAKAGSFIAPFDYDQWLDASHDFMRSIDHYPNHWLLHWMHACQIVGFYHPDMEVRHCFYMVYEKLCRKFHVNSESFNQLEARLNADEDTFVKAQI